MIPIWLALYMMFGCCVGMFYATIAFMNGPDDGPIAAVIILISLALIALWPLWIGIAIILVTLEWLRVI